MMKITKFLICLLLIPLWGWAATIEDHIDQNYNRLVVHINSLGFHERMAQEISQFALIRQLHEDGPNKDCEYSAVGMYPGDPNRAVLDFVHPIFAHLKRTVIPTPEGTSCYALKGKDACIASAVCIALLYEDYVFKFNFKDEDKEIWAKSKIGCPENICKSKERYAILKRANSIYGPEGSGIYQLVIRHIPLFERKINESKRDN